MNTEFCWGRLMLLAHSPCSQRRSRSAAIDAGRNIHTNRKKLCGTNSRFPRPLCHTLYSNKFDSLNCQTKNFFQCGRYSKDWPSLSLSLCFCSQSSTSSAGRKTRRVAPHSFLYILFRYRFNRSSAKPRRLRRERRNNGAL